MNTGSRKKFRGFTLVEMVVSVGIFAIIMTIGVTSLLVISEAYRVSHSSRQALDTVSFLTETMTRDIRIGTDWNCSGSKSCTNGESEISFKEFVVSGTPDVITYSVSDGVLMRSVNGDAVQMHFKGDFEVTDLTFRVFASSNTAYYPFVIISLTGYAPTPGEEPNELTIQTSVSARTLHTTSP